MAIEGTQPKVRQQLNLTVKFEPVTAASPATALGLTSHSLEQFNEPERLTLENGKKSFPVSKAGGNEKNTNHHGLLPRSSACVRACVLKLLPIVAQPLASWVLLILAGKLQYHLSDKGPDATRISEIQFHFHHISLAGSANS